MTRVPDIEPVRDASVGFGLPRLLFPWVHGPLWRLRKPYVFMLATKRCGSRCGAMIWKIPAGYEFDKASVPSFFWGFPLNYTPDGLCTTAALEHDFLCDLLNGGSDWLRDELGRMPECPPAAMVHEHFRIRLHESGVAWRKAQMMGLAVAWFGPKGKAWPWVRLLGVTVIALLINQFVIPYFS